MRLAEINLLHEEIAEFIDTLTQMSEKEILQYNTLTPAERTAESGQQMKEKIIEIREARKDMQITLKSLMTMSMMEGSPLEHV